MTTKNVKKRLEELRKELRAERISYGELAELQSLKDDIEDGDVELLEAAGVLEGNTGRDKNWTVTTTSTCWTDYEVWAETEEEARQKFYDGDYDADKAIDIDYQNEEIATVTPYGEIKFESIKSPVGEEE